MFFRATVLGLALMVTGSDTTEPLTVSAAISLTDSLEAIAKSYASTGGDRVRFNFAGSNALARQLVNGAPADVFISADEAQMDVAERAGAIDRATRVALLGNRLAVITRKDNATGSLIRNVHDLVREDVRRIALGDPSAVPAGVYARGYLQAAGLWPQVAPKIVPVANVRAALTVVENGSADAAIVYETDAALATTAVTAFVVTGPAAPRIVYPAAVVAHSRQRDAAARFLSFLTGAQAAAIFRRFGFTPLATTH
jgi:molybdate transport system substrate-binding protein